MDIKDKLEAWGAWTRDHDGLGCKSPSLMLMRSAPFADASDKPLKRSNIAHISDDDALVIDRAVLVLKQRSEHLRALLDYYVELKDNETGLPHLAHAICCLMFLVWFDNEANP